MSKLSPLLALTRSFSSRCIKNQKTSLIFAVDLEGSVNHGAIIWLEELIIKNKDIEREVALRQEEVEVTKQTLDALEEKKTEQVTYTYKQAC